MASLDIARPAAGVSAALDLGRRRVAPSAVASLPLWRPHPPQGLSRGPGPRVTVTAEERRQIKAAAEAEDLTISAWLRRLVLGGLKKG